jgi:hypothetical protein
MADEAKPKPTKKTARAAAAGLTDAFAALTVVPDQETERPAAQPRPRQTPAARTRTRTTAPMPAEQDRPPAWDARFSLTLSREMKRDLDRARADDGIEGTARIRAMITLWQEDDRLRARIDKLAKTLK